MTEHLIFYISKKLIIVTIFMHCIRQYKIRRMWKNVFVSIKSFAMRKTTRGSSIEWKSFFYYHKRCK